MNVFKFEGFDFNVKPDFEELYDSNELFKYFIFLQQKIIDSEYIIKQYSSFSCHLGGKSIDRIDKLTQCKVFNKYLYEQKLMEEHKEYLKILKERQYEMNEYLESLEVLKEFI